MTFPGKESAEVRNEVVVEQGGGACQRRPVDITLERAKIASELG
jgi:hypothetical protein